MIYNHSGSCNSKNIVELHSDIDTLVEKLDILPGWRAWCVMGKQ